MNDLKSSWMPHGTMCVTVDDDSIGSDSRYFPASGRIRVGQVIPD